MTEAEQAEFNKGKRMGEIAFRTMKTLCAIYLWLAPIAWVSVGWTAPVYSPMGLYFIILFLWSLLRDAYPAGEQT